MHAPCTAPQIIFWIIDKIVKEDKSSDNVLRGSYVQVRVIRGVGVAGPVRTTPGLSNGLLLPLPSLHSLVDDAA